MKYAPSRRSSWMTASASGRLSADLASSVIRLVCRRNWSDIKPLPWSAAVTCALRGSSEERMVQPILRCSSTPAPMKCPRVEDEVPADPFPDKMKIVAGVPHVLARASDQIRLLPGVVRGGPRRSAYVRLRGEDADRTLSAEDAQHERKRQRANGHGF